MVPFCCDFCRRGLLKCECYLKIKSRRSVIAVAVVVVVVVVIVVVIVVFVVGIVVLLLAVDLDRLGDQKTGLSLPLEIVVKIREARINRPEQTQKKSIQNNGTSL